MSNAPAQSEAPPAGNEEVRKVMENFKGRGTMRDDTPPAPPQEALKSFKMREGFTIDLMASEPETEQPLYLSWDSRGRLWVTLYRQYQFPAGLKILKYDQHLRAVFDKVPEPPPKGVKGADRVVVFEDTNGDGKFDTHKTVLEGLNMASAAIKGAGGIWVMNPPYLLFYPDANDDDIPDADPEVCLSGFGLEDSHALANSIQFGPDGWLYGANGSTTTGNVSSKVTKNVKWEGQCIWRYHPRTHVFEIYGEGGGNTFSTELDSQGRVFSGTNGSQRGMHYDQGMSGAKNFGKHGPAMNPYAFGFFDHMETKSDGKRFSQAFCIYDGDLMTDTLGGRIVAANSLQNMVYVSRLIPATSTFRIEDDAPLLTSTDRWFRPVDIKVGPDGGIWMADWYDTRLSHVSPIDDWHKTSGRIYRVRPDKATMALPSFDLHKADAKVLLGYLSHPNKWFRRQAALELAWRREEAVLPDLEALVFKENNPHAIDALFALEMLEGLNDDLALRLLKHADPYVRRWIVRCLGDQGDISTMTAAALKELALQEKHPEVRTQLLCSAKRLPAEASLPIVHVMMMRAADFEDQRIPLLLWWVLEAKSETDREAVIALFSDARLWSSKLARTYGVHHLAQRYALAGGKENYESCAKLLSLAPTAEDRSLVVEGIAAAFEGTKVPDLPASLQEPLELFLKSRMDTDLALAVKTGSAEAVKKALVVIKDKSAPITKRLSLIEALSDANHPDVTTTVLMLLNQSGEVAFKKALLPVATRFNDLKLAQAVISGYEARYSSDQNLKEAAHRMLASRKEWALLFLEAVEQWQIKADDVAPEVVRQLSVYGDAAINAKVQKLWKPKTAELSDAQKKSEMERIKAVMRGAAGDPDKGKIHFTQRCAICHTLFNEGGKVGPDLTGYERTNPDFWLIGVLAPNMEIREGFGAYVAKLKDGQVLMGILEKQDAKGITLRDIAGQHRSVKTPEIESLEASPISLMPEGLLTGLSEADLRDFFAFLMKP